MGNGRISPIKTGSGGFCKPSPGCCKLEAEIVFVTLLALLAVGSAFGPRAEAKGIVGGFEVWSSENVELDARASAQIRITYDQIQVRRWTLVVDGGDHNCDLHVRREKDGSLLYQQPDEQRHEVDVPWGPGEVLSIVVTNRDRRAAFVVSLVGPPRDQVHASYSYHVNRALERFAAGQRLAAEDACRAALLEDPGDGVAKVLLAGFLRDRHYYDRAAVLVDDALAGDLPESMREVAEGLQQDLRRLREPLPLPVRRGLEEIETFLQADRAAEALVAADTLLAGDPDLETAARAHLLLLRGRALAGLDRNFEALDAYTGAMQLARDKGTEAIISFHMGRLFSAMGNLPQAEGAFSLALENGLPSGLEVQARELLQGIAARRQSERR